MYSFIFWIFLILSAFQLSLGTATKDIRMILVGIGTALLAVGIAIMAGGV